MEIQPQNPEFRNNPYNFHLCYHVYVLWISEQILRKDSSTET